MAYTALNIQVFTAAYCGALAGMGLSDRQITDQSSASYAGLASVAGAFAQAVDTAWGAARATTLLDVEAIQSASQAFWQDRSPIPDSTNTLAVSHASAALAMIATITAAESYYASQGLTPPAIPGGSSGGGFPNVADLAALGAINWVTNGLANGYQYYVHTQRSFWILSQTGTETINGNTVIAATGGGRWLRNSSFSHPSWLNVNNWYIDATNGNDEYNGQAAVPAAGNVGPLKTHGELERRWNGGTLAPTTNVSNYFVCKVTILTSLPATDPVLPRVILGKTVILWYVGGADGPALYTGTFTAVAAKNAVTNTPYQLTDAAIGSWTPYLSKRWRISSGARTNTMGWVAKDLGSQTCRSSDSQVPSNMNTAIASSWPTAFNGTQQAPQVGDTFVIENLITITLGSGWTNLAVQGSTSGRSERIVWGELAFRNQGQGISLQTSEDNMCTFYSCDFQGTTFWLNGTASAAITNSHFGTGLIVAGGSLAVSAGLFDNSIGAANAFGIESYNSGAIRVFQDLMLQNVGMHGSAIIADSVCIFDSAVTSGNGSGHGLAIGQTRANIQGNRQTNSWSSMVTRLWGSGNAGAGVYVNASGTLSYQSTVGLTITGAGGDFRINNNTTASPWDASAGGGAGAYLAPRNCTWVNLAASVATTGFGGYARDVPSGAQLVTSA